MEEIETNDPNVRLRIRRNSRQVGQSYTVVAVSPTNRVLAVVEVQTLLEPGFGLPERIGPKAANEIEADARAMALRAAQGVLNAPQTTG